MASDTRRLRVVVTGEDAGAGEAIESVGHHAEKTGGKMAKLAEGIHKWASRGLLAFGALATAGAAMGLKTAMGLEQAEIGFTTMLGSADKAKKLMKDLQDFANKTPFEFPELVGAAQQFINMGYQANEVIPVLTAVGDTVAAMGGSSESIDIVTRALVQMKAKGKVSGEELMQLTEQGIPALKILADKFGVSTTEMSKMVSQGKVLSDEAIPKLLDGLSKGTEHVKGFGGMMSKQSASIQGKWSTMMDSLQANLGLLILKFKGPIVKALEIATKAFDNFFAGLDGKGKLAGFGGIFNDIGLGLRAMVDAFKDPDVTSDGLVGVFERIGSAARESYEHFQDFIDVMKQIGGVSADVIRWFNANRDIAYALATAIGVLTTVTLIHEAVLALQNRKTFVEWLKGTKLIVIATKVWAAVQWALNAAYLANPIGAVIGILLALAGIIYLLWTRNAKFREIVIAVWGAIRDFVGKIGAWFKDTLFPAIGVALGKLGDFFRTVWGGIQSVVGAVVGFMLTYVWPVYKFIFGAIGLVLKILYNAVWKPIWILIQIAVKIVMFWIKDVAWPLLKLVFGWISAGISVLYSGWKWWWGNIMAAVRVFAEYFKVTWWPKIYTVYSLVKSGALVLWQQVTKYWGYIKKGAELVGKGIVTAFDLMRRGVEVAWGKVKTAALLPINFVISTVYDQGIMPLWNKVAKAFGISTKLDYIRPLGSGSSRGSDRISGNTKYAYGGIVPGYAPRQDKVHAMLSPGEGVLVPEAVRAIGPYQILEWNKRAREGRDIQKFADGGIVGFGKRLLSNPIIAGIAGSKVGQFVKQLMGIASHVPGAGLFSKLLTGGVKKALDAMKALVTKKDKETTGGLGNGSVMGWKAQWAILHRAFPTLQLMSAFRPGAMTLTGNRSYHSMGRAIDVSPRMDVFNWIRAIFGKRTKELIFSPAGNRQLWNGRPHMYGEPIRGQHWNHVHWAMDSGGKVPPGWFMGYNGLGRPEKLVNADKVPSIGKVEINVSGAGDPQAVARAVRDELVKLGRRNGGKIQLA